MIHDSSKLKEANINGFHMSAKMMLSSMTNRTLYLKTHKTLFYFQNKHGLLKGRHLNLVQFPLRLVGLLQYPGDNVLGIYLKNGTMRVKMEFCLP